MQLPYSEGLETEYLSKFFQNTSECYKFFWFQAILDQVELGKTEMEFEELVDDMIAGAWYMVSEYHLNLGPRDNLEQAVRYLHSLTGLKTSEKKAELLRCLKECRDKEVTRLKRVLISNVPYRLQAPLMPGFKNQDFQGPAGERIERINRQRHLMYYFGMFHGLETKIYIQPDWAAYIRKNQEIIRGWLRYHMILYLQKRNPSVPGIADKLMPPSERKLERVKQYWKAILHFQPVYDIYGDIQLTEREMSIDHFIPWSYVAHDELWNLHPTTRSINSSKSNYLPDWDTYFLRFSRQEYLSYQLIWKSSRIREEFNRCAREHLNSSEIRNRLYHPGMAKEEFQGQLEDVLRPVYQAARNCGFREWVYGRE